MKSYVVVNKEHGWSHNTKVGQVLAVSRDGLKYAVRINYNGYLEIYKATELLVASASQKRKDKKNHNRDTNISQSDRDRLNS